MWRVRECLVVTLLKLKQECCNPLIVEEAGKLIVQIKIFETDRRVKQILYNEEFVNVLLRSLNEHWETEEEKVKKTLEKRLLEMRELQNQINVEGDEEKRKLLLHEYEELEAETEEQLANVSGVGEQLGIAITFIKEIKKDLIRLEGKID